MAGNYLKKAGGKIVETAKNDYTLTATNIRHKAGKSVSQVGKQSGVKFSDC